MHMSAGVSMGSNAFENDGDPRGLQLSPLAYHFLGGLMQHANGLTAIAAPCVNSYKRLVSRGSRSGATWAPVNIAYGNNNRTAFVRAPGGRIELRVSDSSANPYLLTAAVIYAGLDGIARKLDPGEPCNENLYALNRAELTAKGIGRLPSSLLNALEALEADEVLCDGLGQTFTDEFIQIKREEIDALTTPVSPAEFTRYVDFF